MSSSFFGAIKRSDGFEVRGEHSCALGHRLPADGLDDGVFAGWGWDGHRLSVETDRYGFFPLFYYARGNEFAISTNLMRLLHAGAPLEIDREAIAVFVHLGFFLGDQTPFRHIKAVPPNGCCTWDGTLNLKEVRHVGSRLTISRADAIDQYLQLFRAAVKRRLPRGGDFAVPLSGGRDSRHILLELCRSGHRPRYCITTSKYGAGDNDVEIAKLLTQSLDLNHVIVKPPRRRIEAEWRKNIATSFCTDEHAWLMGVADILNQSVDTMYDGIAGDVLSASLFATGHWLDLHRDGRFRELAQLLMKQDTGAIQRSLDPALRAEHADDMAQEQIARELERYADAANPTTMFFFWNRTRREIALSPFTVFSGVKNCFCPYLDHQLFDFLASLPPEMLLDKTFHTDTISAAHPRFAAMPYSTPRRGSAKLKSAAFGARVVAHGMTSRPRRAGRVARLTAHLLRRAVSPAYREGNASIGAAQLLYFLQLDDAIRTIPNAPAEHR